MIGSLLDMPSQIINSMNVPPDEVMLGTLQDPSNSI